MKKITSYLLLAGFTILTGCNDFLEIEMPKDQIDHTKVFNDERLATAALTQVYTLMRGNGFLSGNTNGCGFLLACYTDELEITTTQTIYFKNFYDGTVLPSNSVITEWWNHTYRQIYTVNTVLEGLEQATAISGTVKQQLQGEALAVRGMLHFYLAQTFGAVPYVTTTDYRVNQQTGKLPAAAVIQRAENDLKQAEGLLTATYPSAERVRINQAVAQALLARLYLYTKQWQPAQQYAETVLANAAYKPEPLNRVFLKDSQSVLWQFKPEIEGRNALEADTYIFEALPAPQSRLSKAFLNSLEMNDLRKETWVRYVAGSSEDAHAYKYTQRGGSSSMPSKEYSVIMRIEELYLIAAEAAAEQNNWETCNAMLNTLRNRAGLPDVEVSDPVSAIEAVLKERRTELFCEFGHRFYDLKRRNRLNDLLQVKPGWQPYFSLLPLPENELLLNPNLLPQNAGY